MAIKVKFSKTENCYQTGGKIKNTKIFILPPIYFVSKYYKNKSN